MLIYKMANDTIHSHERTITDIITSIQNNTILSHYLDFSNYPTDGSLPDSLIRFFPDIESSPLLIPCEHCNALVEAILRPQAIQDTIKGFSFMFISYTAYCPKCNHELFWGKLDTLNQRNYYDAYRKQKGLISLEEVRELPHKYNIGKRPLSLVLGWGELTFSRFYDGDVPSEKYSKQLLEIYHNPKLFRDILCRNSDSIPQSSVQKCLRAVDEIIGEHIEDECLVSCAKYICTRLEDISARALQKLLYYTAAFFFLFFETDCFVEHCVAWQHGPVFTSIYYLNKEGNLQSSAESLHSTWISPQLRSILDEVIRDFGCYSGDILRDFTHAEQPWRKAWEATQKEGTIIDYNVFHSFFLDVKQEYKIDRISDISRYSQAMFERCR